MVQPPDGLHFALEADDGPRIIRASAREDFQGDDAVEPALPGLVDRAHAAAAEPLDKLVLAQLPRQVRRRTVVLANRQRPCHRPTAAGLVLEWIGRRGTAKPRDQGIVGIGQRGQFGLALRTSVEVAGQAVGSLIGKFSDNVIDQFFTAWAGSDGHGRGPYGGRRVGPDRVASAGPPCNDCNWSQFSILVGLRSLRLAGPTLHYLTKPPDTISAYPPSNPPNSCRNRRSTRDFAL